MNHNRLLPHAGAIFCSLAFFAHTQNYCMDYSIKKNQFKHFEKTINGQLPRRILDILKKTPGYGQEHAFIIKFGGSYNPKEPQTPEELVEQNIKELSQIIGGRRLKKCLKVEIPKRQNPFVNIFYEAKKKSPKSPSCKIIQYFCVRPQETAEFVHKIINRPDPDPWN